MTTKSYFLLNFLETYKCQRMYHMNLVHKFDDTKEMFNSNIYVIHLEVFFSNCLHYNRNTLIGMVKNNHIYIYIYICTARDYTTMMSFFVFILSNCQAQNQRRYLVSGEQ